jgi:hypothetical protein
LSIVKGPCLYFLFILLIILHMSHKFILFFFCSDNILRMCQLGCRRRPWSSLGSWTLTRNFMFFFFGDSSITLTPDWMHVWHKHMLLRSIMSFYQSTTSVYVVSVSVSLLHRKIKFRLYICMHRYFSGQTTICAWSEVRVLHEPYFFCSNNT